MSYNLNMKVSKKVDGEYQEVGAVDVPVFSLVDFGINIEPTEAKDDDGLPLYEDKKVQYVFDSLLAATKADARNKLVSGTANLKAGAKIASTVEELIAKAERSGAALQLNRDFLASFASYLKSASGKSEAVQALYNSMVKTRASIALSSEARRQGLLAQIEAYTVQASAEDATKFGNILTTISEQCQGAEELSDADL